MTGSTSGAFVGSRAFSSRSRVFISASPSIGAQGVFPLAQLDPAGRDRDQFLVQPGRPWAVEAEPSHQYDSRNRVFRMTQAGPGEVVEDEPLGGEPPE